MGGLVALVGEHGLDVLFDDAAGLVEFEVEAGFEVEVHFYAAHREVVERFRSAPAQVEGGREEDGEPEVGVEVDYRADLFRLCENQSSGVVYFKPRQFGQRTAVFEFVSIHANLRKGGARAARVRPVWDIVAAPGGNDQCFF